MGKHVGADPDQNRQIETGGYVALESGATLFGDMTWLAGVAAPTVAGVGNAPPYAIAVDPTVLPANAVLAQTGMRDTDGGWPILYGANPLAAGSLSTAIDEDRFADAERAHGSERVAWFVTGNSIPQIDVPVSVSVDAGEPLAIVIDTDDRDNDPDLVLSLVTTVGAHNSPVLTDDGDGDGSIAWTPGTGDLGTYQFEVSADDGRGGVATRSIEIVVDAAP
jgi:hypothetical protein